MIKPVDEIPMNVVEKRKAYRERIVEDIREAMRTNVNKFEFIGDYNFKTLANTAREEARHFSRTMIRNWLKEHPEYNTREHSWPDVDKIKLVEIHSLKGETPEKTRVFCEINPDPDTAIKEYLDHRAAVRKMTKEG